MPTFSGFEKLRSDPFSSLSYQPQGASSEIGRNPNVRFGSFDKDCNAAYQCAILGHITGNKEYYELSTRIIDDWATTLARITGADAVLCAALGGFKLVNAAELARWSDAGWPAASAHRFAQFARNVILPVIVDFAPFANGNWDTAAIKTIMAIAIFTDDRELFDRALVYYNHDCGDGRLTHYIYSNGQCQESGRDQQHTQLGIGHLGDCCEMAWNQGLDLYGMKDNRLLLGFEYTARYCLGEDVPFTPDVDETGKYRHAVIAPRSALRPLYEQIFNHYARRRGLSTPWTSEAADQLRPEGAGFQADQTGFGTLLYTRGAGPDPVRRPDGVPGGPFLSHENGGVRIDWVPVASGIPCTVVRKDADGGHPLHIAVKAGESSLVDTAVLPGRRYSYRVITHTAASPECLGFAGLPDDWHINAGGHTPEHSSAFTDGNMWSLRLTSDTETGAAKPLLVVRTTPGKGTALTGRLLPQFACQSLRAGLVWTDANPLDVQHCF